MLSENALYSEGRPILYLFVYPHVVENRQKRYSCHFHMFHVVLNKLNDGRPFKYLNGHLCNPHPFTLYTTDLVKAAFQAGHTRIGHQDRDYLSRDCDILRSLLSAISLISVISMETSQ